MIIKYDIVFIKYDIVIISFKEIDQIGRPNGLGNHLPFGEIEEFGPHGFKTWLTNLTNDLIFFTCRFLPWRSTLS